MESYEITYIVRPDLDEEQIRGVVDGVTGRITGNGGEMIAAYPWNPARRRLAYPIRDFGDGFYVTSTFRFAPEGLKELERALRLNDNLLRFLIVQATDLAVQQSRQRAQQAVARATAAPEQPATGGTAPAPQAETAPALSQAEATPAGQEAETESQPAEPVVEVETQPEPVPAASVEE